MSADPIVSPGAALAAQARLEARTTTVLLSQMSKFLDVVLAETLASRRYVSGAFYADAWTAHMSASALSAVLPADVAEYIAVTLADSPTPDEAWSSAMSVLTRSSEQAWSASDEETALRAALSMDSGETFLTAAAPVVKRDANGRPVYRRTAALDEGGISWSARMKRDARTSITGLWNDIALAGMLAASLPEKMWITRHDERVRDEHRAADGQIVPIDQPFIVDGFALKYPGDRSAPIHLTVNCRCVVVGVGVPFSDEPDLPDWIDLPLAIASDREQRMRWVLAILAAIAVFAIANELADDPDEWAEEDRERFLSERPNLD